MKGSCKKAQTHLPLEFPSTMLQSTMHIIQRKHIWLIKIYTTWLFLNLIATLQYDFINDFTLTHFLRVYLHFKNPILYPKIILHVGVPCTLVFCCPSTRGEGGVKHFPFIFIAITCNGILLSQLIATTL